MHSPVYVEDLVEGVVRAAGADSAPGRTYILTGAEHVAFGDFVAHYARMLGKPPPRSLPYRLARTGAAAMDALARARGGRGELTPAAIDYLMRRGTYSIARAQAELGYAPAIGLDEGMSRTESWLRTERLL
jgi:nucleoside-diphosphate-sugar epimerase